MDRLRAFIVVTVVIAAAGIVVAITSVRSGRLLGVKAASSSRGMGVASAPRNQSTGVAQAGTIRLASNGTPVPPFLVNDLDGQFISTADWHGKVVLLNFWATWCPSCRQEIPQLINLANRYQDRLQVIGVSMDDAPPAVVREFAMRIGVNYPIVMASPEIVREYGGVPALPATFVVDTQSRVVQKHVGLYPPKVYENEVRALLGMPVDVKVETFEDFGQIFLKNASLATELPGVDFKGLTPEQKKGALKRMNSETCNCGCMLTIAQCRINDTSCPISKQLAARIIKEVVTGSRSSSSRAQE
jgi:thiol-disulfide isomerase/thioredoxin